MVGGYRNNDSPQIIVYYQKKTIIKLNIKRRENIIINYARQMAQQNGS